MPSALAYFTQLKEWQGKSFKTFGPDDFGQFQWL
jgi:hypothetical protein